MDNILFKSWAGLVRASAYRDLQREMYVSGNFPQAILAGGECYQAFRYDDREIQLTTDGGVLWRGVPLIRITGNKAMVVWAMEEMTLPQPVEVGQHDAG